MEYIHLIGAEQVQLAGHSMRAAADEMSRAANSIAESLAAHQQWADEWLERLRDVLLTQAALRQEQGQ